MHRPTPYGQILSKLIFVIFLVVHAPISGVLTAAQALAPGGEAGPAGMVICAGDGFKLVAAPEGPGGPGQADFGVHECLCPCATLCGTTAAPAPMSVATLLVAPVEARPIAWPAPSGLTSFWPPHAGQGHPRAPPASNI